MKYYFGVFAILVVAVVVALWPKPNGERQDAQQPAPPAIEKQTGTPPPKEQSGVEDDVPTSNEKTKITMHRRRAGEPDKDGWYLAESTGGGFAVKLPNTFNDFTVTAKREDGGLGSMHLVGTRTQDETQYSVIQAARKDKKPISEVLEGFENSQGKGLKEKLLITQAGMQGIQTKAVVGPTAGISRMLVNETATYLLMIENRAGTVVTPQMEQNAPIFFESFRLK